MEERLYQMKDLIERFGVTRDTIKYYEKMCLITPGRSKSGYRFYTETDVQKIKTILELKNMGFSLKNCETHLACDDEKDTVEIIDTVRKDLEEEIKELSLRLQRLEKYREHQQLKMGTKTGIQREAGYAICYGCEKLIEQYTKDSMVCDIMIYHMDDLGEISSVKETIGVMVSDVAKIDMQCPECSKEHVVRLPEMYVKYIQGISKKELEDAVKEACAEAKQQGIQSAEKVYVTKNLFTINGNENIAFHIFVPQKK